jgi:hypothetical protein
MPTIEHIYIDTGAGGLGTGVDWTNAYLTASSAMADNIRDLTIDDVILFYHARASTGLADGTQVSVGAGCTTDATRYAIFQVEEENRHTGIVQTGYHVRKFLSNGAIIGAGANYTIINGVSAQNTATSGSTASTCAFKQQIYTDILLINCLFVQYPFTNSAAFLTSSGLGNAINCIIRDSYIAINLSNTFIYTHWYNCTITSNSVYGFFKGGGGVFATVKGCVVINQWEGGDFINNWTGSNNGSPAATDAGFPGGTNPNNVTGLVAGDVEVDKVTPSAGSQLLLAGLDNTAIFAVFDRTDFVIPRTDVFGNPRPNGSAWALGAVELATSGGSLFRIGNLDGISTGGPFFGNPLG